MRCNAAHATVLAALAAGLIALAGCGSSHNGTSATTALAGPPKSCPATVVQALSRVVRRVYREGLSSERTAVAQRGIAASVALRQAIEAGSPAAVRAAAEALVASGRMTNLTVMREGHTLADVGGPAVSPLAGTIMGATGKPIATYLTSVWSDTGFLAETDSIASGLVSLRVHGHSIAGKLRLPAGKLPAEGSIVLGHVRYQFASFGGKNYPSGPLRVYLLRTVRSTSTLCGATSEDTVVAALSHVASLIYAGEAGARTVPQIQRVQAYQPLLEAVSRRDPAATKTAVEALLNQHIVRLRIYDSSGQLLSDVGGPYVLAPVTAPLTLGGRKIGSLVLSIQDDEGYLRLTKRLAGLRVLMYMDHTLVKNSLGPEPGTVPESGRYQYQGATYRVFTLHVKAFPDGPLTINVLIPIPYT
jgi:hypothetical protein